MSRIPRLAEGREVAQSAIGSLQEASCHIAAALSDGVYPELLWVVEALDPRPEQAFATTATLLRGLSPHFNADVQSRIVQAGAQGQGLTLQVQQQGLTTLWPGASSETRTAIGWLEARGLAVSFAANSARDGSNQAVIFHDTDAEKRALRQRFSGHVWPVASSSFS